MAKTEMQVGLAEKEATEETQNQMHSIAHIQVETVALVGKAEQVAWAAMPDPVATEAISISLVRN